MICYKNIVEALLIFFIFVFNHVKAKFSASGILIQPQPGPA